jgi:hypothetical protein
MADIECVQIMVFRGKKHGGRESRRPRESVAPHLHDDSAFCFACSDVVKGKCSIGTDTGEYGGFA